MLLKQRAVCSIDALPLPLPPDCLAFIAHAVAGALRTLHEKLGIVYRGLCGAQLLLTEPGGVLLVGWGGAKALPLGEHTFTLCGAAEFLAPEQMRAAGTTRRWTIGRSGRCSSCSVDAPAGV